MVYYETLPLVLIGCYGAEYNKYLKLQSDYLEIDFSSYVVGQNHLGIATQLYTDRDYSVYYSALKFLKGDNKLRDSAVKALKYFYTDLSLYLTNCARKVNLRVSVSFPEMEMDTVSQNIVRGQFIELLKFISGKGSSENAGPVDEYPYIEFFDSFDMSDECVDRMICYADNYSLAAVYNHYANMESPKIVVVKE